MNTEITDTVNVSGAGWVCYDAECGMCVRWTERLHGALERRGYVLMPLQSEAVRDVLRVSEDELLREMRVVTGSGEIFSGADAVVYLSQFLCRPFFAFAKIPGVTPVLRMFYGFVARNRNCGTKVCPIHHQRHLTPALSPAPRRRGRGNRADGVILATKDFGAYGNEIVPPVQGGEVNGLGTRAFSPGYHIDGLSALLNGRSEIAASEVHARPALIGEGGRILGVFRMGNLVDWLPLFVLPPAAAVIGKYFPAWVYMWVLAFALFAGCKWVCLRSEMRRKRIGVGQAVREVPKLSSLVTVKRTEVRAPGEAMRGRELLEYPGAVFARTMGFLFGWVGMDVEHFLRPEVKAELPQGREWLFAGLKILLGAGLVWMGARAAMAVHPLLAGWIGMFGIILVLHFGLFHLLALGWRAAGVPVTPLMRVPLLSRSLGEFWGSRWNTAFNRLVATFLFRPLHRATNVPVATLIVFLVSGLLHEFVISVPARGGYGLPTLYFLLQGLGVLLEHTPFARRLGLGRGVRGWLFMFAITGGPAFWLFHPPFIEHVILPMLHAIGAT